jgi:glycosyltransferase involved in cell wall biosynthesis
MATTEDDSCLNIRYLAGASNKLAEYMSCGLPVVVPASETYRGFIEDNGVGILVDNSSPQNIAAGLNKLFLNSAMREEISARAKTHFASSLSYEAQFQPVLEAVSRDVD